MGVCIGLGMGVGEKRVWWFGMGLRWRGGGWGMAL